MNSILGLLRCAERHLLHHTDPAGGRAFWAYDRQGNPDTFDPVDALAPGLLDAPVPRALVVEMFADRDTPAAALRGAMQHLLDETSAERPPRFENLDLEDERCEWELVRSVLRSTGPVVGIRASKATKMLHRKRPTMVPIFDSKVAAFYGVPAANPGELWPVLQGDLRVGLAELTCLAVNIRTSEGRQLTPLRALDIIIWEHQVTGCTESTPG